MLIAKIIDETISIADYRAMFPNTSFPSSGPPDDFLTENNCYKVSVWLPYNDETEKLVSHDPYLMDNFVYTVVVEQKTQEEIEQETLERELQHQQQVEQQRSEAYRNESDPIFFKYQRNEATQQEWLDKVAEIKARYPD
jgi:hypothetical protein